MVTSLQRLVTSRAARLLLRRLASRPLLISLHFTLSPCTQLTSLTISLLLASHFTSLHFPFHLTSHTFSGLAGNTSEQAVALALLLLGSVAWGLVLATIVSVLSHIDRDGDEFTSTMSELNKMMIRQGLPNGMRTRRVAQTRRGRASYLVTHALSRTYPTAPFASHLAIMACANYPTGCESIFTSLGTSVCMPSRLSSLASCHPRCRAR